MITIKDSIVVIIWIFTIWYTIVVVVNIVDFGLLQAKGHDSTIPNGLVETVAVCICVISIIIVVDTIAA